MLRLLNGGLDDGEKKLSPMGDRIWGNMGNSLEKDHYLLDYLLSFVLTDHLSFNHKVDNLELYYPIQ